MTARKPATEAADTSAKKSIGLTFVDAEELELYAQLEAAAKKVRRSTSQFTLLVLMNIEPFELAVARKEGTNAN